MATGAYYGNPNIQRQGEKARQIAQQRNVSDIADPRTYGFMQGLFGTAPDQLGYSVFDDPATKQAAQQAAEVGFVGGGLLSSLPIVGPALRGYGRLAAGQVNRAMMGEGGLLGPITPQPMYVVPPGKKMVDDAAIYKDSSVLINPKKLSPLNKVEDAEKYKTILNSMEESGYQGRPILAYMDKGKAKALTGSHRIFAAREAGIDVPVVFVNPSVMKWEDKSGLFGTFKESINDQRVYEHLKAAGDDVAASLSKLEDSTSQPSISPYPQQAALDLAQQRAALPISEGGLGLPVGNTAMDRSKAMGYPMGKVFDVSYEMGNSPIAFTNTLSKPTSPRKKAEIIKAELEQMGIPVVGETAGTGSTYLKIPGNPYDISSKYGGGQAVPIETLRFSTHSKREFGKPTNTPDVDSYLADVFPKGGNTLEDARKAIDDLIKQGGMRSRFAAFDPFRRNAAIATVMGVALPDLLAQPVNQYQPTYETSPTYTDPFGNTIGSSIR
jgi:hypothetical protein